MTTRQWSVGGRHYMPAENTQLHGSSAMRAMTISVDCLYIPLILTGVNGNLPAMEGSGRHITSRRHHLRDSEISWRGFAS